MSMLSQIVDHYETDAAAALNSARQLLQEVILSALWRSGFFSHAAFQGGTQLRIFHGLDRFSEDLDFCITDSGYRLDFSNLQGYIEGEIASFGVDFRLVHIKRSDGNICCCTIKGPAADMLSEMGYGGGILREIPTDLSLKIKIDVDTQVPRGYSTVHCFKRNPLNYGISLLDLPSLFAGKTSAVLSRHWRDRVKGRDLYDFEWYVGRGVPLNMEFLEDNLVREGVIHQGDLDEKRLLALLGERFRAIDYDSALRDLLPFVNASCLPADWGAEHFIGLSERMTVRKGAERPLAGRSACRPECRSP